jgi:hypothetical protein
MKKNLFLLFLLLTAAVYSTRASVTINLSAGDLTDQNGAAFSNGLLLIVASGADGIFYDTLSAGQFVGGDDVVLGADYVNHFLGGLSSTSNVFTIDGDYSGQTLAVRWFSDFTLAQYLNGDTPTNGVYYGTFAGATTGTPNGGKAWSFPASGSVIDLKFITDSANANLATGVSDPYANSVGMTLSQVGAVPEPSQYAVMVSGLLALLIFVRRRNRSRN